MALVFGIVRTNWSGTTGGPGLTQTCIQAVTDPHSWNAAAATDATAAVRKAWLAIATMLPDNIKLDVQPVVDVYTAADGELVGSYAATAVPAQVVGASAAVFSMASGIKVNLNTGQIRNGRRVRGSIFIVPATSAAFTTDGMVLGSSRSLINSAFSGINTDLGPLNKQLAVWSRPIPDGKKFGPRAGGLTAVSAVDTSEKGAILRGRRD